MPRWPPCLAPETEAKAWRRRQAWVITASSIEALSGNLSSVRPAVRTAGAGHTPEYYLQPDGALGPSGSLGAWGPLGPLGPVGAYGLAQDSIGYYTRDGARVRTVRVPYEEKYRTYELCENYPAAVAHALTDNDTSFMVSGSLTSGSTTDYSFTAKVAQYVTIALVPESSLSDFQLRLPGPPLIDLIPA